MGQGTWDEGGGSGRDEGHGTREPLTPNLLSDQSEEGANVEHSTSNVQRPTEEPLAEDEYQEMRKDANGDEMQHIGWVWVCPSCGKEVRVIYYPVAVMNLFDCGEFEDPAIELKLGEENLPRRPEGKFACGRCHDVSIPFGLLLAADRF